MTCIPLPKAAKPVWVKQLTRPPCLVVTTSKIGSQLLLASTSSNVQLGRGSEKTFNECPLCRLGPNLVTYFTLHNELSEPRNEVS